MNKTVIQHGLIYDGSGNPPYQSDLLIVGDHIQEIAPCIPCEGCEVIQADGLAVCPGMIDIHTHFDLAVLQQPMCENFLQQGVTSIIVGLCGLGFLPMSPDTFMDYLPLVSGIFGPPVSSSAPLCSSLDAYLGAIRAGCNVAAAATHSAARIAGAGFENVSLTGERLVKARYALREVLEQGAVGFSTGESYFPHYYATPEELFALSEELTPYGVPLMIHLRSCYLNGLTHFDPTWEAAQAALRTGAKLHVLHYKTRWPEKREGTGHLFSAYFDKASAEGADITYELYPYNRGASLLTGFLPEKYLENGWQASLKRLADRELWPDMESQIQSRYEATAATGEPVLSYVKNQPEYAGKSLRALSDQQGISVGKLIRTLLLDNELGIGFLICDPDSPELLAQMESRIHGDIIKLMNRPDYMVGSDSIPAGSYPHPRLWGCFPKMLRLAREYGMPLESMLYHLTKLPAQRYQLKDRGEVRVGAFADIVLLQPQEVMDRATYASPTASPTGIPYVLVNGVAAVSNGIPTGVLSGRGLRRNVSI